MLAYHGKRQVEALAAYDFLDGLEQPGVGPQQSAVDRVIVERREKTPHGHFRNIANCNWSCVWGAKTGPGLSPRWLNPLWLRRVSSWLCFSGATEADRRSISRDPINLCAWLNYNATGSLSAPWRSDRAGTDRWMRRRLYGQTFAQKQRRCMRGGGRGGHN